MSYCDTNIINAFVNKDQLQEKFDEKGVFGYPHIGGGKDIHAENKLKNLNLNQCKVSKKALFNDLRGHQASMGGALTSINLKNIEVVDVDGFQKGREIFSKACATSERKLNHFQESFCNRGKLKDNLKKNQIEDIRHIGSAMELGEKEFITGDKELKSLNNWRRTKFIN